MDVQGFGQNFYSV